MRWKYVQLDPDTDLSDRFEGTAEEAARHALTIPIGGFSHILTVSDEPLTASPVYPAAWFVREVRHNPKRSVYTIAEDTYDHGGSQARADWLISY